MHINICLFGRLVSASTDEFIEVEDDFTKMPIGKYIWVYEDVEKESSIIDITAQSKEWLFKRSTEDVLFYGYKNSCYWLRFTVSNKSSFERRLCVNISYPLLYKLDFYQLREEGKFHVAHSGDGIPFDERQVKDKNHIFEIVLQEGESSTYFCRIESEGDVIAIPIQLYDKDYYYHESYNQQYWLGIYYGILILVVLINFFFFLIMKDRTFLFYILYVISIGLYLMERDGLAFQYLWPNSPVWGNYSVLIFVELSMIFILIVAQRTLNTKKNLPRLHKFDYYYQSFTFWQY